jgi:hypothetical protein
VQTIEDVRVFAGQTMTFSFWAKTTSGTQSINTRYLQAFGTGGSATVEATFGTGPYTATTAWQRFSSTVTLPSVSGKTIGADSRLIIALDALVNTTGTVDIWGWQVEAGSYATPFQLAGGGDPQSELAMCQRYYYRTTAGNLYSPFAPGCANGATSGRYVFPFAVTMRVKPTALEYSTLAIAIPGSAVYAVSSLTLEDATNNAVNLLTANSNSGLSNGAFTALLSNNSTSGYIGVSSEL